MPTVVAADPGSSGAIACLRFDNTGALTLHAAALPTVAVPGANGKNSNRRELDVGALRTLLSLGWGVAGVDLFVLEKVHAMPRQGVASSFTFGCAYGELRGAVRWAGWPLELPTPQAWKGVVLKDTARDKAAALAFVTRRFPDLDLRATPRSRTPCDGIADAVCLALYGRYKLTGIL